MTSPGQGRAQCHLFLRRVSLLRGGVPPGGNHRQKVYNAKWIWSTQCSCVKVPEDPGPKLQELREAEWCQSRWWTKYCLTILFLYFVFIVWMELSKIHHYKLWSFSLPSPLPIASLGTYDPSTFKLDGEEAVPDPVEDSPDVPAPTKCGSCGRVVIVSPLK